MNNINSVLKNAVDTLASVSDSALLDAEILLCQALNKHRSHLRAWPDRIVEAKELAEFNALLEQRKQGTPIAYITGYREFWSRDFLVTPDVLIPRPDTELLIELSLELLPTDSRSKIIDLGTGSGIIAITLAAERPNVRINAVDISLAALTIAQINARKHQINNILFYQSDWFTNVPDTRFNLIISNPPYIAEHDRHLQQGDLRFEPHSALCSGDSGLKDINIIAATARNYLELGGHLLIEHGYDQQEQVQAVFRAFNYANIETCNDLSGQPRVTYGLWNQK